MAPLSRSRVLALAVAFASACGSEPTGESVDASVDGMDSDARTELARITSASIDDYARSVDVSAGIRLTASEPVRLTAGRTTYSVSHRSAPGGFVTFSIAVSGDGREVTLRTDAGIATDWYWLNLQNALETLDGSVVLPYQLHFTAQDHIFGTSEPMGLVDPAGDFDAAGSTSGMVAMSWLDRSLPHAWVRIWSGDELQDLTQPDAFTAGTTDPRVTVYASQTFVSWIESGSLHTAARSGLSWLSSGDISVTGGTVRRAALGNSANLPVVIFDAMTANGPYIFGAHNPMIPWQPYALAAGAMATRPRVANNNGTVLAVWVDGNGALVAARFSSTWSAPAAVGTTAAPIGSYDVVALPDGGYAVTWQEGSPARAYMRRMNGSGQWDAIDSFGTTAGTSHSLHAAGFADGHILALWAEDTTSGITMLSSSYTPGNGWSTPATVGPGRPAGVVAFSNGTAVAIAYRADQLWGQRLLATGWEAAQRVDRNGMVLNAVLVGAPGQRAAAVMRDDFNGQSISMARFE